MTNRAVEEAFAIPALRFHCAGELPSLFPSEALGAPFGRRGALSTPVLWVGTGMGAALPLIPFPPSTRLPARDAFVGCPLFVSP